MSESGTNSSPTVPASDRLESWKEVAAFLGRDVRTVQRWERTEGLPIRRHMHSRQGSVYALRSELEEWKRSRLQLGASPVPEPSEPAPTPTIVAPASSPQTLSKSALSKALSIWGLAGFAVLAVLLLAGGFLFLRNPSSGKEPPLPSPFTTLPGSEISPSFSPDGTRVAFAWNGNPTRKFQVCVQAVGSYRLTQLTNAEGDSFSPTWSPSGDRIAFLRHASKSMSSVMVVPAGGGTEKEIATINYSDPIWNRNLSWSPDGQSLVSTANSSSHASSVMLISVASGNTRLLTHPPEGTIDMMPVFSPDGRSIAFVRDNQRNRARLEWLRLGSDLTADGEPVQLGYPLCNTVGQACLEPWFMPGSWILGRQELIFTLMSGGASRLWRASVPDGPPRLIQFVGEGASQAAVSAAGDRIVYQQVVRDFNIYAADLTKPGETAPVIVSTMFDSNPSVSPDGKRVLFESTRSGHPEIWVSGRDGANAAPLTSFGGPVTGSPQWSPDGARIVFDSRISGQPQIYVMDANGHDRRQLTSDPGGNVMPSWSPDGKWIYFTSQRSGNRQIWKLPSKGGAPIQMTHQGGLAPFPSTDGHTIYYMKTTGPVTAMWQVPEDGGRESLVIETLCYRSAAVAPHGIYYFTPLEGSRLSGLDYLDLTGGGVRRIFTTSKPVGLGASLTPDLHYLFYTQLDTEESDLKLVQNFR